jgi:hypothetical protein
MDETRKESSEHLGDRPSGTSMDEENLRPRLEQTTFYLATFLCCFERERRVGGFCVIEVRR